MAPVEEFPEDKWEQIISINLSAAFYGIRYVLAQMRQRDWGRIINIASAHGLVASTQKVGYVAAKHGLVGITKVVALETAETGVTCNAICPGWVLTPLVQKQIDALAASKGVSAEKPHANCLAKSSLRRLSLRPLSLARSRSSCAPRTPPTCAARRSTWTAAGLPSEDESPSSSRSPRAWRRSRTDCNRRRGAERGDEAIQREGRGSATSGSRRLAGNYGST